MANNKPWLTEPNKLEWVDTATGLRCLILRNSHLLHLCGYVKLPDGWTMDGVSFDVHGGVTFTGTHDGIDGSWIGFDCGHYMDLTPGAYFENGGTYRTIDYVKSECEKLATGIKACMERQGVEAVRLDEHQKAFGPDTSLTAVQLDDRYNQDGDGEHPKHTVKEWARAAANDETRQGYWDWVVGVIEHEADMAKGA